MLWLGVIITALDGPGKAACEGSLEGRRLLRPLCPLCTLCPPLCTLCRLAWLTLGDECVLSVLENGMTQLVLPITPGGAHSPVKSLMATKYLGVPLEASMMTMFALCVP
mmetsp:Transcript_110874/g.201435  ORF Transcript_110874/g.201435 Transcript_110874/m.201435 type:complete len:109 (+) Transcript_110874:1360-1686(+)